MDKPLLIADVPWLLYRAFFGVPKTIVDKQDRPVNALLGTVNTLLAAQRERPPRAIVCTSGAENAVHRVKAFPPYHAQRPPMPPELARQWDLAPQLLSSLGWTFHAHDELEADDLILSYSRAQSRAGGPALVLTADKDLFQVVDDNVRILEMGRNGEPSKEIGPAEVRKRYGVAPELVPDFIALRGDPSDNIPGAPGIGEKTARDLLVSYGSLEGAIAHAARERPRVSAALRDNAEQLRMFREIATCVEVEVDLPSDAQTDYASGAEVARELGMGQLARRLQEQAS
jgi:DNA polymerase-1